MSPQVPSMGKELHGLNGMPDGTQVPDAAFHHQHNMSPPPPKQNPHAAGHLGHPEHLVPGHRMGSTY